MTPTERIGELIAAALDGSLTANGRALQQAIGEHLGVTPSLVAIDWSVDTRAGVELTIRVPR